MLAKIRQSGIYFIQLTRFQTALNAIYILQKLSTASEEHATSGIQILSKNSTLATVHRNNGIANLEVIFSHASNIPLLLISTILQSLPEIFSRQTHAIAKLIKPLKELFVENAVNLLQQWAIAEVTDVKHCQWRGFVLCR